MSLSEIPLTNNKGENQSDFNKSIQIDVSESFVVKEYFITVNDKIPNFSDYDFESNDIKWVSFLSELVTVFDVGFNRVSHFRVYFKPLDMVI